MPTIQQSLLSLAANAPIATTLLLLGLSACGDGKRDIKNYYFPISELRTQSKVYEYWVSQNGVEAPEYWYYRAFLRDSGEYLACTYYDQKFQIGQILREKIVESGALVKDYFLYEMDSVSGKQIQTQAVVSAPDVFPFRVKDSTGVFLFNLSYAPPDIPESKVYVVRNRRFLGDGPSFDWNGSPRKCIRFSIKEVIGNQQEGDLEINGVGEEWYAEGLGLVYYKKTYGEGSLVLEGKLQDIFPMAELERRAAEMYGEMY